MENGVHFLLSARTNSNSREGLAYTLQINGIDVVPHVVQGPPPPPSTGEATDAT